jgi:hypothetical protein
MSSSAGKRERRNTAKPDFVSSAFMPVDPGDDTPSTDDSIAKKRRLKKEPVSVQTLHQSPPIMARSDAKNRLNAAADALEEELGTLSTSEQIANGSHYRSMLRNGAEDIFKDAVWGVFMEKIRKSCDKERLWDEMAIYRLIGQTSHFLVPDEELDKRTLHNLERALELWVFLAATEKLYLLLRHQDYKQVRALKEKLKVNSASPAVVFQAFVSICKNRAGITRWTETHMNDLRYGIYEVVLHVRQGGDVPHQSGTMPFSKRRSSQRSANIPQSPNLRLDSQKVTTPRTLAAQSRAT